MPNNSATGGLLLPNPPPAPQPLQDADLVNFFQAIVSGLGNMDPTLVRPRWQAQPPPQPGPSVTWAAIGIHNRKADTYPFEGHFNTPVALIAGGQLTATQQLIATWSAITNGGFQISAAGNPLVEVDGVNLSTVATLFDVAIIVQGAIETAGVNAVQAYWNDGQFILATRDGTLPALAPLQAPATGGVTDLATLMALTSATMQENFVGTITADRLQRHETLEILCSFYGPGADTAASLVRDGFIIAQNREALRVAGMALVQSDEARAVPAFLNNQWYYRLDLSIYVNRVIVRDYPVGNVLSALISLIDEDGDRRTLIVT